MRRDMSRSIRVTGETVGRVSAELLAGAILSVLCMDMIVMRAEVISGIDAHVRLDEGRCLRPVAAI